MMKAVKRRVEKTLEGSPTCFLGMRKKRVCYTNRQRSSLLVSFSFKRDSRESDTSKTCCQSFYVTDERFWSWMQRKGMRDELGFQFEDQSQVLHKKYRDKKISCCLRSVTTRNAIELLLSPLENSLMSPKELCSSSHPRWGWLLMSNTSVSLSLMLHLRQNRFDFNSAGILLLLCPSSSTTSDDNHDVITIKDWMIELGMKPLKVSPTQEIQWYLCRRQTWKWETRTSVCDEWDKRRRQNVENKDVVEVSGISREKSQGHKTKIQTKKYRTKSFRTFFMICMNLMQNQKQLILRRLVLVFLVFLPRVQQMPLSSCFGWRRRQDERQEDTRRRRCDWDKI